MHCLKYKNKSNKEKKVNFGLSFFIKRFRSKKQYDYIMSIGQACATPHILRELNIRRFSGPLDWTNIPDYNCAINVVKSKFDNYFAKEDLEFAYFEQRSHTDVYINKRNFIRHIHCFPPRNIKNFDDAYCEAYEKYKRRIRRFLTFVEKNKNPKILLLYIEIAPENNPGNNNHPLPNITNEILEKDILELNKIYGKEYFDILYIKHNENLKMNEYFIDNHVLYLNNTATNMNLAYRGNYEFTKKLIRKFVGLKTSFYINCLLFNLKRKIKLIYILLKTCLI